MTNGTRDLWTAAEAAEATGGEARGDWAATGISIDTRTLEPGDLFVALTAERDGHDFAAQALERGAAAAMVSRIPDGVPEDAPLLIVPEVLEALTALGRAGRSRSTARVIAITGSVGKTSTKEMLRTALSRVARTHAAEASFNNHWGVPITLARMPRDAEVAVIEIGMNAPGEIAPLARLARPHAVLITTVAPAHLEAFGRIEGIAAEKASIVEGLEPGGTAILNADLPTTPILRHAAEATGCDAQLFGEVEGADWRLTGYSPVDGGAEALIRSPGGSIAFHVGAPGRHMALNGLGALAVAAAAGFDADAVAEGLSRWTPFKGRGTRETLRLPAGEITLVDDAFNANPTSLAAALEVLAGMRAERRVAILGDMLELGAEEGPMHAAVAEDPSLEAVAVVHTCGLRMMNLHAALPEAVRGHHFDAADSAADAAGALVSAGDVVLVKGSKGSEVSRVVDALRALGQESDDQGDPA